MRSVDFADIEKALECLVVPDDIIEVIRASARPDPEATERIKQRTMQLVQQTSSKPRPLPKRSKTWYIAAVAVAAILLLVVVVGPNKVGAAVNQLLTYIPGFGIHSTEDVNLAAPNPIRAEKAGVRIDINGVLADNKGTSLMAYVEGVIPDFNSSYLVDISGNRYPYQGGNMVEAGPGTFQTYWAGYKALPANVKQVALVIPSLSNWTISIPLAPAANLNAAEKFGPSVTVNNVILSGQATSFADETKITFLVQSLRGGVLQSIEKPLISGADNKLYPISNQPAGFIGSGLAYYSTSPNIEDRLTVTVPSLMLQQEAHGSTVIPLPKNDLPLTLNQSLNLNSWTLKLTTAEVTNQNDKKWLKVYVETNSLNGAIVNMLDDLRIDGRMDSWSSEFDPSTGGIKWFQIPFPDGRKTAKIAIGRINVLVHGPWKIEMPVELGFR